MVELGILFFQVLLARILHKKQVGVVRAGIALTASVDVIQLEVDRSSLLANSVLQFIFDPGAGRLAGLVLVVGDAGVDGRACVRVVHAVVEDLADAPEWASDGDFAEANRNVAAFNARVPHIADHSVCAANVVIAIVRITLSISMHGRHQHDREEDEDPGHTEEHVDIGNDSKAKLAQRLVVRSLWAYVLLRLGLLLLDHLASVDHDCVLGVLPGEQISHLLLVHRLALIVRHLRDATTANAEWAQARIHDVKGCLCDRMQLLDLLQRVIDLVHKENGW